MQTKLKNVGILIGFLIVCFVAQQLAAEDGSNPLGIGAVAGFLLGASITLWGIEYQKYIARTRPSAIWMAFTVSFLTKFAGLAIGPMIAVLLPSVGERCDWRALLVAYGFAAVLVLLLGSPEVSRALKVKSSAASSDSEQNTSSHNSSSQNGSNQNSVSNAIRSAEVSITGEQAPLDSRTCI